MWIWVGLCTAVLVLYVLTTSTFHAVVRPRSRSWWIMVACIGVADEVRDRWRAASRSERECLTWAYYRIHALGTLDRVLSFAEFRQYRRVTLAASVALGRRWQRPADPRHPRLWRGAVADVAESLWFGLRVLVRPTLLLGRSGRGRLPRLPVRRRFRRADPGCIRNWRYRGWTPYACFGENGYRPGWYQHPVWDDDWMLVSAALTSTGGWSDGVPVEWAAGRPARGGPAVPDRAELEARQGRREEALERLGDQLREIAGDLVDLADAYRQEPPTRQEREDPPPKDPSSGPSPSLGSSGGSGGSSYRDDSSPSDDRGDSYDHTWD